jgi:hypothetical protein
MLKAGDLLPHFSVTTLGGEPFAYSDVWQRKNLLLVSLSHADSPGNAEYVSQLASQISALTGDDIVCVVTSDNIAAFPLLELWSPIDGARSTTSRTPRESKT